MQITLANFQREAIRRLMDAMAGGQQNIVLKSCTGSGKTIILTHFMDAYCKEHERVVFIWLTPGKGNLEEQSKEKMDRYIHGSQTKRLSDVMSEGFAENDACFINWEKLTKKGNHALKDSERTSFLEHIGRALEEGLSFVIIVDESHQHDTIKAGDIMSFFQAGKIIRCSATPKKFKNAELIEIPEEEVIAEGLIKKVLVINEDFAQNISVESQTGYLLGRALEKQQQLHAEFLRRGSSIHPLIIVQIPNRSDILEDEVERYFEAKGLTYENGQLAIWLSNRKQNLEGIEEPDAKPAAVIIKQAVATGWDCPRAHILVKLRDNMSETFEIQTIGRIRRMPEAKHYGCDLLDSCYLYTMDEKFTEGVRMHLGKNALDAMKLYAKPLNYDFVLKSEQKTSVPIARDGNQALRAVRAWFQKEYGTDDNISENRTRLEAGGYIFDANIRSYTISGKVITLDEAIDAQREGMNVITIDVPLDTHKHGRDYHHHVAEIGRKVGLTYSQMNKIVRRLFDANSRDSQKILLLATREVYAFVLNNIERLKYAVRHAMAEIMLQPMLQANAKTIVDFTIPKTCMFTYDSTAKVQEELGKNVYKGYLSSAEPRSASEKDFELFCEERKSVDWFYKNGDKGAEYFSIVYEDNFGKQRSFYPDYIVSVRGELWIIETKGGFDRTGKSEDIDIFSPRKFEVLKTYLTGHELRGGFVRMDKKSRNLCICMERYHDNIESDEWKVLREVF